MVSKPKNTTGSLITLLYTNYFFINMPVQNASILNFQPFKSYCGGL